jgi:CRISPR/Cas system-associated exonuclease Cas4 (RecB family)
VSQTQYSHSRVSSYEHCPRQFQYRYIDKLRTVHAPEADNALIIGNALHTGAEKGQKAMLEWYFKQFSIIDDLQVHEDMKLSSLLPKLQAFLDTLVGDFRHEYLIDQPSFKGFVDLIVSNADGSVDIYDYKYSNNIDNYLKSAQLHLYKYYLEQEGFTVNRLGYIFVPKTLIRQKKDENLFQFRWRLIDTLSTLEIDVRYITYDFQKVQDFWNSCKNIEAAKHYPKNPTFLCDWCDYKNYCLQEDDTMILPSTERREISTVKRKTLWIYGAPFSGKTWFANVFPNPLMLNTDGNTDFVDAPVQPIRNEVSVEGRITKTTLAWDIFKDTIAELEKKQNDFQTIIVDLLEDCYEHCRIYMYGKLGIEHESDNSFKAWDMVKTEFLSTMKRLLNLPYDIILISHEDMTKDFTKKTGDKVTRIAPNIQEKAGLKIAGMVHIVARVVSDDNERWLTFKTSEVEFGGGRLGITARKIPLDYQEFARLYTEVNQDSKPSAEAPKRARKSKDDAPVEEVVVEEPPAEKKPPAEEPPKRGRRSKSDAPGDNDVPPEVENTDPPMEEAAPPKRTRSSRTTEEPAAPKRTRRSRS